MFKFVDLSFNYDSGIKGPQIARKRYREGIEYAFYLREKFSVIILRHIDHEGEDEEKGVMFRFFRARNIFFYIPIKALRFVKKERPDIVFVQGLNFPFQLLLTRMFMLGDCTIIVQHHGELPYRGIKKVFQRLADRWVAAYLFTAHNNANAWVKQGIIRNKNKCFEVLEASSFLKQQNNELSKLKLRLQGENNFLWVGRLDANKDPLTVLSGFEKYLEFNPRAMLYMIYQTVDMLSEVKLKISNSVLLTHSVKMIGEVAHNELEIWYSACDHYLSGSHKEGSGYALLEAMACGCTPIVTDIPSFRKITADGRYGFLYEKGNADGLFNVLTSLNGLDKKRLSNEIVEYFKGELSFEKIAADIYEVCRQLKAE